MGLQMARQEWTKLKVIAQRKNRFLWENSAKSASTSFRKKSTKAKGFFD
jgi:hypothetical protein